MRVASIKPNELALVDGEELILIGDILAQGFVSQRASMIDLIAQYDSVKNILRNVVSTAKRVGLDSALLKPPVERPSKIWAAAFNYKRGTSEIKDAAGRGETLKFTPEQALEMTFLKPSSAVIGPEQTILIPKGERVVYPELELCVVIGREARNVAKTDALDYVFGYTVMLDMTARGPNSPGTGVGSCRSVRKGFETFAPIGLKKALTTKDTKITKVGVSSRHARQGRQVRKSIFFVAPFAFFERANPRLTGYGATANVWSRGLLYDEFGLKTTDMK
jgi:2-keto-4-pentenoate hydratase/2-oxohepta-3-ene-1,7-dioic acid hydratase in catechol pathway